MFVRIFDEKGPEHHQLVSSTIRSVTSGILGVALIQTVCAGLGFLVAGLPGAGLWAVLFLIAAVLQVGMLVLIPAVIYMFAIASTTKAIIFLIWCIIVGMMDNLLKPLLLVRGDGETKPALKDRAVVEAKVPVVKVSVQLIQVLHEGIEGLNQQIQEAAAAHPDFFIFDSLPGAGAVMAPRLLAAFGSERERYQNAAEVQTWAGIAPVTESSGKSSWVHFRFACSKFLRQSFHEFAACSIPKSPWARAYYELQRHRGKKHHAAVRALAFKWIRIMYSCWKKRVAYDEKIYLAALAIHNSPLVATIGAAA
jgi:hypothetical protein